MFRKNESYKQAGMFDIINQLTKKQTKILEKSEEHVFFEQVFMNIDEASFEVLYSKKMSRPNAPVNQLVGALILKHNFNWTYEELFKNLTFNILTRHAIGINSVEEDVFSEASLFNFLNRLSGHFIKHGEDLIERTFKSLTSNHLERFKIKTNIQRGDSFLMGSNIIDYTRLNLLLEVLIRFVGQLNEFDKEKKHDLTKKHTKWKAHKYIYKLDKDMFPKEIKALGQIYYTLYNMFKSSYRQEEVFKIFERTMKEHFTIEQGQVVVIPTKQLNSKILMSPDDVQASYRRKGEVHSKGFVGHISETAHPDNEFNLITDLAVEPNNKDDAKILEERLPKMMRHTPDIEEYHCDGLYGNPQIDKMTEGHITMVQATQRGRKSGAKIRMYKTKEGELMARCEGGQEVDILTRAKSYRAEFDLEKCNKCPFKDVCKTIKRVVQKTKKECRVTTFSKADLLRHLRLENIANIPEERKTLRANVEATVKECKKGIKNGKLRVRGKKSARLYLMFTAIGINLRRISKYLTKKGIISSIDTLIMTVKHVMAININSQSQLKIRVYT